ncbi:MAG TPA: hypothetical protein VMF60_00895 [Acidimicrobiales bacterium]|nr:hypothetical protein [Acidimicrobiales bacterium]
MGDRATWARARRRRREEPVRRALLLMALGLDPKVSYSPDELRRAWRRKKASLAHGARPPGVSAAALDAAYAALAGTSGAGSGISLEL